ncbi:MAG: hypothetical protein ACM3ML_06440 [Micromonosporaceae bacterium]
MERWRLTLLAMAALVLGLSGCERPETTAPTPAEVAFDMAALPSAIVGTATLYKETDILGVSGPLGPGKGMYKITARGTLADSRSFLLMVNEVQGELREVEVRFGR